MRRKVDFSGTTEQLAIVEQVIAERTSQDRKWGGAEHDDEHDRREWMEYIRDHSDRARKAIGRGQRTIDLDEYRHRLIVIAALALAALEAHDRDIKGGK